MLIVALLVLASGLSLLFVAGCSDTLTGDQKANQKPIVYFVNIPPDGYRFSRNPVIYWVGTDRDGIVTSFRYHVATVAELNGAEPLNYAQGLHDTSWVVLEVDPKGPDPRTSNIVSMSAALSDPVRSFVNQYVFLQGFDEQGLGSDIVYRLFARNDNPPETNIFGFAASQLPFVNSPEPGGIITGVKIRWEGQDPIDYPSDPPPFEFRWELFGPYTEDDTLAIADSFFTEVYVTADGQVYDLGDTIIRCDTFYVDDQFIDSCDTIVVAEGMPTNAFGGLEPSFRADDQDFINSQYFKPVDSSWDGIDRWVLETDDTLYDVFRNFPSDTTLLMYFIFQIRSRDDARVADLVPAYRMIPVINPRYERDIGVLDYGSLTSRYNAASKRAVKAYFTEAINAWAATTEYPIVFDTTTVTEGPLAGKQSSADYFTIDKFQAPGVPVSELLKHKVLVMINDDVSTAQYRKFQTAYTAIDAGVNVWACMRSPYLGNGGVGIPEIDPEAPPQEDGGNYTQYFGVEAMVFSGWFCHLFGDVCQPQGLWQDFVGTYAMEPEEWPALSIDTARLHSFYQWAGPIGNYWPENMPAVPEVNWSVRSFGTEVLYLYKSGYGQSHPLGYNFTFQGNPVGQRLGTNLYRTVHFNFTPVPMEQTSMQVVVNRIFDWLYDPTLDDLEQPVAENRYKDGRVHISLSEAQERYRQRMKHLDNILSEGDNAVSFK